MRRTTAILVLALGLGVAGAAPRAQADRLTVTRNGLIVFARTAGQQHLYSVRPDGSGLRQLTNVPASDDQPSISPDGRRVALVGGAGIGDQPNSLYVMSLNGTHLRRISHSATYSDNYPAWSSDGTLIAFIRQPVHGGITRLWVMSPDGKHKRRFNPDDLPDDLHGPIAWSPNSERMLIAGGPTLYAIRLDGRGYRAVGTFGASPAWSPNGKKIAFLRWRSCGGACETSDIYLMGRDGRGVRKVVEDAFDPAWSPDGGTLLYVAAAFPEAPHIIALDLKTGRTRNVTMSDLAKSDAEPKWQPRCQLLVTSRRPLLHDRTGGHLVCGLGGREVIVSGGHDRIFAGPGKDTINIRNRKFDLVSCGRGVDRVRADPGDHVATDCEVVSRR